MPNRGVVIGNGLSRLGFDLHFLDNESTVGCNMLYKDYEPNYLVAIDKWMTNSPVHAIEKIVRDGDPRRWKYITRVFNDKQWHMAVEDEPVMPELALNNGFCKNSGMYGALYFAQVLKMRTVYLLGIDFFQDVLDENGKKLPNDVYGGTFEGANIPGFINAWQHMFNGAPSQRIICTCPRCSSGPFPITHLIPNTRWVRVGPIADHEREFYSRFENLEFIESFDDFTAELSSN